MSCCGSSLNGCHHCPSALPTGSGRDVYYSFCRLRSHDFRVGNGQGSGNDRIRDCDVIFRTSATSLQYIGKALPRNNRGSVLGGSDAATTLDSQIPELKHGHEIDVSAY